MRAPPKLPGLVWSGKDVRVELTARRPPARDRVRPQRFDRPRRQTVAVEQPNRSPPPHRPGAEAPRWRWWMHILAALTASLSTNCEIWVDGPEMPGCRRVGAAFVAALGVGLRGRCGAAASRRRLVVKAITRVGTRMLDRRPALSGWPTLAQTTSSIRPENSHRKAGHLRSHHRRSFRPGVGPSPNLHHQEKRMAPQRGLGKRVDQPGIYGVGTGRCDSLTKLASRTNAFGTRRSTCSATCRWRLRDLAAFIATKAVTASTASSSKVLLKDGPMEQGQALRRQDDNIHDLSSSDRGR